ncbi:hypothetical protein OG562_03205 [Streptomyces sp. NBC_01275]|nr:hypothetical protein [Streptomyces sp. NBC_01275]MCX4760014.1 hypothetical protein [Streptomyces sp. NBC_01275]
MNAPSVDVRLPSGDVSAAGAYRTSAGENMTAIGRPCPTAAPR